MASYEQKMQRLQQLVIKAETSYLTEIRLSQQLGPHLAAPIRC